MFPSHSLSKERQVSFSRKLSPFFPFPSLKRKIHSVNLHRHVLAGAPGAPQVYFNVIFILFFSTPQQHFRSTFAVRSLFENATFCLGYAEKHYLYCTRGKKERMLKLTGKLLPEAKMSHVHMLKISSQASYKLYEACFKRKFEMRLEHFV